MIDTIRQELILDRSLADIPCQRLMEHAAGYVVLDRVQFLGLAVKAPFLSLAEAFELLGKAVACTVVVLGQKAIDRLGWSVVLVDGLTLATQLDRVQRMGLCFKRAACLAFALPFMFVTPKSALRWCAPFLAVSRAHSLSQEPVLVSKPAEIKTTYPDKGLLAAALLGLGVMVVLGGYAVSQLRGKKEEAISLPTPTPILSHTIDEPVSPSEGLMLLPLTDGGTYSGHIKDGVYDGLGVLTKADGTVLRGNFTQGQLTGDGVVEYRGRTIVYEGALVDGHPCGQGNLTFWDGRFASGNFACDSDQVNLIFADKTPYAGGMIQAFSHGLDKRTDADVHAEVKECMPVFVTENSSWDFASGVKGVAVLALGGLVISKITSALKQMKSDIRKLQADKQRAGPTLEDLKRIKDDISALQTLDKGSDSFASHIVPVLNSKLATQEENINWILHAIDTLIKVLKNPEGSENRHELTGLDALLRTPTPMRPSSSSDGPP